MASPGFCKGHEAAEEEEEEDDSAVATASLHIKNFTRPLQLREVTALLEENGKLIESDDGFWMDKQKRRCCCTVCEATRFLLRAGFVCWER